VLQYPPKYIIVSVPETKRHFFAGIFNNDEPLLVPISTCYFGTPVKVRLSNRKEATTVNIQPHPVTMSFAFTFHKVEGQTLAKVVVDVNPRPFAPHLLHSGLFTAISRVRRSENIRFMPLQPGCKDLNHLLKLRPPDDLYEWLDGFDADGGEGQRWNVEKAKAAHNKHLLKQGKNRGKERGCKSKPQKKPVC